MEKSTTRDYSSIYGIKEMVLRDMVPQYFQGEDVNSLHVGLIGMTTDVMATGIEDGFAAMTALAKEMLPSTAMLPETILANAALYKINDVFAKPARMDIALLVNEIDIVKYATRNVNNGSLDFRIDSETIINVNGMPYMLDHDIIIQSREYGGQSIYNTLYDTSITNPLNKDVSPYLKNLKYVAESGNFLAIMCTVHQVFKNTLSETLISNNIINFPKFKMEFDNMLANIEVFYRAPDKTNFIQLDKLPLDSTPLNTPFFYYTFTETNAIEVSFATSSKYFRPEYNSEIRIELYTSRGTAGNFETKNLDTNKIDVIPQSSEFAFMPNITLYALPQSDSYDASNSLAISELKRIVNNKFASINSLVTTQDLTRDFSESKYTGDFDVAFYKKRDDVMARQFSAFSLFKTKDGETLHTSTLDLDYNYNKDTSNIGEDNVLLIKPGTIFKYSDESTNKKIMMTDLSLTDEEVQDTDEFLFTNPFLMTVLANPNDIVGYYLNSVDKRYLLSYDYMNMDSKDQFICNVFSIKRNALKGENSYKITVNMSPSASLSFEPFDKDGAWLDLIKVKLFFNDGVDISSYIDFKFESRKNDSNVYTFSAELKTDDLVTISQRMRVIDVNDIDTGEKVTRLIPYDNLSCYLDVFVERETPQVHKYSHLPGLANYQLTNEYSSELEKVTLMKQFMLINSYVEYYDNKSGIAGNFGILISQIPLVSAQDMLIEGRHMELVDKLYKEYDYLNGRRDLLTNNYTIDLKFICTYGRSNLFKINRDHSINLDRLNCKFRFDIYTTVGTDKITLESNIKRFIHTYFESVNSRGHLSIKVSNLIQELENSFPDIDYLVFQGINDYDTSVQLILNTSKEVFGDNGIVSSAIFEQIPEYATVRESDVILKMI